MKLSLQENVLTLLCYSDLGAGVASGLVHLQLFDNEIYRRIADRAVRHYRKFGKAPKAHIADLLDAELTGRDRKAEAYRQALKDLHYVYKEGFNEEFILSSLREFLTQQRLKAGIVESAKLVQLGDFDKASDVILKAISQHDAAFDPGVSLRDARAVLNKLETEPPAFKMGIPPFDKLGIGPVRKGLLTFMAPTNRGKTWGLIHIGKHCLMQRLKVLHVTLEMSEAKILSRYLQSLFALVRGHEKQRVRYTVLSRRQGIYRGHRFKYLRRKALSSDSGLLLVKKRLTQQHLAHRFKLIVKEFPTASLSIKELSAYLDLLERTEKFIPDVLIIDYADLMDIDTQLLRVDTGRVYKELRGLGVKRNLAVITATQSNRQGEDARYIGLKHMSEDYSKAAISDVVLTYNQTPSEKQLGLARLYAAKVRDERSGFTVVISQSYESGQFNTDAALLLRPEEYLAEVANGADAPADDS